MNHRITAVQSVHVAFVLIYYQLCGRVHFTQYEPESGSNGQLRFLT